MSMLRLKQDFISAISVDGLTGTCTNINSLPISHLVWYNKAYSKINTRSHMSEHYYVYIYIYIYSTLILLIAFGHETKNNAHVANTAVHLLLWNAT